VAYVGTLAVVSRCLTERHPKATEIHPNPSVLYPRARSQATVNHSRRLYLSRRLGFREVRRYDMAPSMALVGGTSSAAHASGSRPGKLTVSRALLLQKRFSPGVGLDCRSTRHWMSGGHSGVECSASRRNWHPNEEAEDSRQYSPWGPKRGGAGGSLPVERINEFGKQIGSQYGEGFSQLGSDGTIREMDVQTLNKQLRVLGAERMRHAMHPDAAYGMVFSWEGVLANTRNVQRRAWQKLAQQEGLRLPALERRAMYDVLPERAITEVLNWTRDWGLARNLARELSHLYRTELLRTPVDELIVPGARQWLQALRSAKVPCAVVTSMDRPSLHDQLDRAGLLGLFEADVTAADDMETSSELLLGAAIKLRRPPNQCIAFTGCPQVVAAAHNCTMKAVGILGTHRNFELKTADVTVGSMSELSVYNIRRMFAHSGLEFMDLSLEFVGDVDNPRGKRHITNGVAESS